jgi:hypothetical protein
MRKIFTPEPIVLFRIILYNRKKEMNGLLYLLIAAILIGITIPVCIGASIGKKTKAALIAAASLVTVFAVVVLARPIYITQADATREDKLAQKLSEGYFGYEKLDFFGGVSEYKIKEASLFPEEDKAYLYVIYDVKPYRDNVNGINEWAAGNGTTGENGWIVEKSGFYGYGHFGGFYFVAFVGTGL